MTESNDRLLLQLKRELKVWEKNFAADHEGRKATRADIKSDECIAAKYKQYDQLCRPEKKLRSSPQKRTSATLQINPLPQVIVATTPQKSRSRAFFPSPAKTMTPTPQALRLRLGPTPQRDGQILSLFEGLDSVTPSRARNALHSLDVNIAATPSRQNGRSTTDLADGDMGCLSQTPLSADKGSGNFATPMKRKRDGPVQTPSRTKEVDATPQFLRRNNVLFSTRLEPLSETHEANKDESFQPSFKKRGLVRSLSSIIRGMKDQYEEEADDDLDLLREMEADAGSAGAPRIPKPAGPAKTAMTRSDSPLEHSPSIEMPLGPDTLPGADGESSSDDADGSRPPRKVWKKKGLKRQTKRVNMRPVLRLSKPDAAVLNSQVVLETQADLVSGKEDLDNDYSDFSDKENNAGQRPQSGKDGNVDQRKKRKVNALAHTNFCKLKIKNQNTKANGRGRFARR